MAHGGGKHLAHVATCRAARMARRRAWDRAAWFVLRLQVLRDDRVGRDRCVVWLRGREMRDREKCLRVWRRAAFFVAWLGVRVASEADRASLRLSEGGGEVPRIGRAQSARRVRLRRWRCP